MSACRAFRPAGCKSENVDVDANGDGHPELLVTTTAAP